MTDEPDQQQATGFSAAPTKRYSLPQPTPAGFIVEMSQWHRILRRVKALGDEPSPSWLVAVATTCGGIAVSALIAVLVIPTTGGTRLGSGVRPALWAILGAATLVSVVLFGVYRWLCNRLPATPNDICDEMTTIEAAWHEAAGADLPQRVEED
jgi:hypothetical protein